MFEFATSIKSSSSSNSGMKMFGTLSSPPFIENTDERKIQARANRISKGEPEASVPQIISLDAVKGVRIAALRPVTALRPDKFGR